MQPTTPPPDPFARCAGRGLLVGALTVDDRLRMVRDFNALKCRQALRVPGLQPTVRRAINHRLAALADDLGDTP
jgi:hypothetical protein